jgi:membrane fusion protein (multidrug efflux system)
LRVWLLLGLVILLAAGGVLGLKWWTHGRFVQTTDDAYLHADQVIVAPKVSGYVEQVYVTENQAVSPGQLLARIDARSYQAALAQQGAAIDARRADIALAERQLAQQEAAIDQSRAQLAGAQANVAYTAEEAARYKTLSSQGVETQERAALANNQHDQASATLKADAAAVAVAQRQVAALQAQIAQAKAQLEGAQAQSQAAELNVGDTLLRASIAGRIGDKTVQLGQFVQPGTRLMSIVPTAEIYLVANFKETQIGGMRIGQRATIKIDALGGATIQGRLESFAPGTGAQFALLPPENATGNFTKIVQRVPVRFSLEAPPEVADRLLPGLSATVQVDTQKPPVEATSSIAPSGAEIYLSAVYTPAERSFLRPAAVVGRVQ